ncbi:MAG TPA: dihydroxy-acid dehydratase [Pyrinomonadaceae bacterium]
MTVSGETIGSNIKDARVTNNDVIRSLSNPVSSSGGTAVLFGNLAPDGAVIKPTAAEPRLLKHKGPAVVFSDYNDLAARIDNEDLQVDENSVLVLQNAGPLGGPWNAGVGNVASAKETVAARCSRYGSNLGCENGNLHLQGTNEGLELYMRHT